MNFDGRHRQQLLVANGLLVDVGGVLGKTRNSVKTVKRIAEQPSFHDRIDNLFGVIVWLWNGTNVSDLPFAIDQKHAW